MARPKLGIVKERMNLSISSRMKEMFTEIANDNNVSASVQLENWIKREQAEKEQQKLKMAGYKDNTFVASGIFYIHEEEEKQLKAICDKIKNQTGEAITPKDLLQNYLYKNSSAILDYVINKMAEE